MPKQREEIHICVHRFVAGATPPIDVSRQIPASILLLGYGELSLLCNQRYVTPNDIEVRIQMHLELYLLRVLDDDDLVIVKGAAFKELHHCSGSRPSSLPKKSNITTRNEVAALKRVSPFDLV